MSFTLKRSAVRRTAVASMRPTWQRLARDGAWALALAAAVFALSARFELAERIAAWSRRHEVWQADELPQTLLALLLGLLWFAWRRARDALHEARQRRQAEQHIAELLARNQELARRCMNAEESERHRIARELHDEIGQDCAAMRAEALYLTQSQAGAAAASAARISAAAARLHGVVRRILARLRPLALESLGLTAALQELCEQWEQHSGIACAFFPRTPPPVDDQQAIALYRIAQEALTNIARHSGASQVRVELSASAAQVQLAVSDNGCGLPAQAATPSGGLGLLGMRERVAACGGQIDFLPAAGGGLRILARLPLLGSNTAAAA